MGWNENQVGRLKSLMTRRKINLKEKLVPTQFRDLWNRKMNVILSINNLIAYIKEEFVSFYKLFLGVIFIGSKPSGTFIKSLLVRSSLARSRVVSCLI